jgi:hypothetical protein
MTTQTMIEQPKLVIKLDKHIAKTIDSAERKKLVDTYLKLYSGFAWVNWTNKQSLGRAWQTAFAQCDGFMQSKNKNNPVAKYLNNVADAHKAYWSRVIMTHQNSPNTLNKTPDELNQMKQYGQKQIREAMDIINLIAAKYNVHTEELEKSNQQSQTKQPSKQMAPEQMMPEQKPVTQKSDAQQAKQMAPEQMEKTAQKSAAQRLNAQQASGNQSEKVIKRPVIDMAKPIVKDQEKQQEKPIVEKTAEQKVTNTQDAQQLVKQRINMFIMAHYNQKSA